MAVVVNLLTPSVGWNANKESRRRFGDNALQETGSLPTVIFFANCFFSTLDKEVPLPTRISCSRQNMICRLTGFADCQAVGKELQSAKAGHG
jgi:hypothetical protein